jgi:hypothetical protein
MSNVASHGRPCSIFLNGILSVRASGYSSISKLLCFPAAISKFRVDVGFWVKTLGRICVLGNSAT